MSRPNRPRVWREDRPVPDVWMLDGLLHSEYAAQLVSTGRLQTDHECGWTEAITDPRSDLWGVVLERALGVTSWWAVGDANGILLDQRTPQWPWEAADEVRHLIVHEAFSRAHREGRIEPYWTLPDATSNAS